jgi:catechol 2,3-dioxygenase-like lactoylglutathione lyase family enzyme
MIESIDHFVITVADVETTLAFYERVLGLTRSIAPRNPAALKFGSQKINVHATDRPFEPKAKSPTPGAADFCFVADRPLEAVKQHVEKCGVTIEVGPVQRTGARGEMTSIYFRDPDGNLVEVSEYRGSETALSEKSTRPV